MFAQIKIFQNVTELRLDEFRFPFFFFWLAGTEVTWTVALVTTS